MDYKLSRLGEFKNKATEHIFLENEIRKGITLIRMMLLFSGIANLLFYIADRIYLKGAPEEVMTLSLTTRLIVLSCALLLFILLKRIGNIKTVGWTVYAFACLIYGLHLYVASRFAPVHILFEAFNLVILTTCLFLLPNRWIKNLSFSLAFIALFVIFIPYICTDSPIGVRVVTMTYICWNTIVISILFYRINIYKRNHFAKTLQLEELANTDQLTKIHNRKACDDILEHTCGGSTAFSVIMFDIDNFKLVNDTYGHVAGDDVIVNIITYARKIIRKDDILARWGGEEFVVVMPGAALDEAAELARRVKEQISLIKHDRIDQPITCSFGVTTFVKGENAKSIISRADQLLYLAKEYGKNRVVAG